MASTLLATVWCPTTLSSRDSVEAGLLADEMKNFLKILERRLLEEKHASLLKERNFV